MKTLDHLASAVKRALSNGEGELKRYFESEMSSEAQLKFDYFLVKMEDPLAYQAGTTESRFVERCTRMLRTLKGPVVSHEKE